MKSSLYFIALLLPPEISDQITLWKKEIQSKYGAKHALKSPPHITLQMPFLRNEEEEQVMIQKLKKFANLHIPIDVCLSGFGCFPPRVVYVDVDNPGLIIDRYHVLRKFLQEELSFSCEEPKQKFHPHITLATRDLPEKKFLTAWLDFKEREYHSAFQSNELSLLKHNETHWEVLQAFLWRA